MISNREEQNNIAHQIQHTAVQDMRDRALGIETRLYNSMAEQKTTLELKVVSTTRIFGNSEYKILIVELRALHFFKTKNILLT